VHQWLNKQDNSQQEINHITTERIDKQERHFQEIKVRLTKKEIQILEINALKEQLYEQGKQLKNIKDICVKHQRLMQDFEEQVDELWGRNEDLLDEETNVQKRQLEEMANLNKRLDKQEDQLEKIKDAKERLSKQLRLLVEKLNEQERQLDNMKYSVNDQERELQELNIENERLDTQIRPLRTMWVILKIVGITICGLILLPIFLVAALIADSTDRKNLNFKTN